MDLDDLPAASMVVVFSMYPRVLVFHASGESGRRDQAASYPGANRYEARTVCGRLMSWHEWLENDRTSSEWASVSVAQSNIASTWMRLDHALAVGRPCARCFPST